MIHSFDGFARLMCESLTKTPDIGGFLYSKSVVDNETEY